eukprot:m.10712 g.10712  ORF g.10712 m.10712 type:complete len:60 (+) comp6668_c0_seq2:1374-1553(+)
MYSVDQMQKDDSEFVMLSTIWCTFFHFYVRMHACVFACSCLFQCVARQLVGERAPYVCC